MAWKGASKGKGPSFLQAAIEGVVVSALGLAPQQWSKGSAKGGGKAAAKGRDAAKGTTDAKSVLPDAAAKLARTCRWEDCRAARGKSTTWGTGTCCFACQRPLNQQPPVEKLAAWAFEALVADKHAKAPSTDKVADKGKGKSKAAGKGKTSGKSADNPAISPPKQDAKTPDADELAQLRKERLELLKNGPASKDDADKPTPVAQEMSKLLVMKIEKPAYNISVCPELEQKTAELAQTANEVIKSPKSEKLPAQGAMETPAAVCEKLLSGVAACASTEGKASAEKIASLSIKD